MHGATTDVEAELAKLARAFGGGRRADAGGEVPLSGLSRLPAEDSSAEPTRHPGAWAERRVVAEQAADELERIGRFLHRS